MPHHVKYCYFLLFTLYLLKREKPSRNKNVKIKDIPHVTFYLLFGTHIQYVTYIFFMVLCYSNMFGFFLFAKYNANWLKGFFFVWTKHNINKNRNHAKKKSEIKTSFFVAQIEKVKYVLDIWSRGRKVFYQMYKQRHTNDRYNFSYNGTVFLVVVANVFC